MKPAFTGPRPDGPDHPVSRPHDMESPGHMPPCGPAGGLRAWSAMETALAEAREAAARGEVPVGAVVLDETGTIIARAGNQVEGQHDACAHAEMLAMRLAAQQRRSPRLNGCTLVVTLEPCPMCAAGAVHFRIERVVFGAYDPKGGGVEHGPGLFRRPGCLHRPEVIGGVRERESADLLRSFFQTLRREPSDRARTD